MEDIDDDFGELYADLEFQPSSPIHCISELLCIAKTEPNKEAKLNSTADDDTAAAKVSIPDADGYTGSDSEDDLNILLNDDDHSPSFPVTCGFNLRGGVYEDEDEENRGGLDKNLKSIDQSQVGNGLEHNLNCVGGSERGNGGKCGYNSQYKYVRPHAEAISSSKGNGCSGIGSYSFVSGRREQEDNGCNQHMRSSSLVAQRKLNFSLPRSRTILDVNIDAFGHKPWRLPEADITDYFNFGFDEVSWKHYCNKLDQCRHGEYISTKILASESRKTSEACETALEERKVPSLMTSPCEQNGKAIQVEDSILDRQPSMEVMHPLYRDSDVIQINLQESKGESSGSLKGISALVDCSEFEMSENGDSEHDNGEDRCLDSAKRHAKPPKERKGVRTDSDNYERAYKSDDGYHHQEVEFNASNETIEANMEIPNHKKEKIGRMSNKNSSEGEHTQHSPSSSFSGHVKRASPYSAKLWDSVASDYYHSTECRDHNAKTREGEYKYYGKRRRGQAYTNNHNRRINGGLLPKSETHLYDDDYCSLFDADQLSDKNRRVSGFDDFYHRKDSYYRSPQGNVHESFGVENEEYFGRNLDEEEYYLEERMSRMDNELMEKDWFRYDRRLDVDDRDPIFYKEHSFRRRIDANEFFPEEHPPSDFRWDRYEKPVPYDEYDENLPINTQIPGRVDCRNRSPSVVFDDLRSIDEEDEFWRFRDRRAFASHPCAEAHNSPRNDFYERHTKYKREIWTERSKEKGWCGSYFDAFDIEESVDNRDNDVVHQRHYWKSEVLHWKEDEIASFSFQRNLRPKMFDAKKHDDEGGQVEWRMSNLMNQGNRGNWFGRKSSNMMCRGNYDQTVRRSKNSVQERKSYGRLNARGGIYNKVKPESITWNINVEKKNTSDKSKVPLTDIPKLEQPSNKKVTVRKNKEGLDIEEGQIIAEEIVTSNQNTRPSNNVAEINYSKEMLNKNAKTGNQVKKSSRILEVIAKMEKRRERFKEPFGLKKDPGPNPNPEITSELLADPVGERVAMKQKRPLRKRRWGGN